MKTAKTTISPYLWMCDNSTDSHPRLVLFRNTFTVASECLLEFSYSADDFATIFLDGQLIGYGPERGSYVYWHKNHLSFSLSEGTHELRFRVSCLGAKLRPDAQMTIKNGLWIEEKSSLLSPVWECRELNCILGVPQPDWGQAPKINLGSDETTDKRNSISWEPVVFFEDSRILHPQELPPMRHEEMTAFRRESMPNGNTAIILDRYMCMNVDYLFSGTGRIEWRYHEHEKLLGCEEKSWDPGIFWDSIEVSDQDFRWYDLWFRAGKAIEFRFTGTAQLKEIHFTRTGYPWNFDRIGRVPSDTRMANLIKKALWTIECCTENTYMDCPYYERLQYVADSRVEMLSTYAVSSDLRLPRNAVRMLAQGICTDGALNCRCPSKDLETSHITEPTVKSDPLIPGFSLLYIQMLHDYARLREDDQLVLDILPVARRIIAWAEGFLKNGLLQDMPGWNFLDWLPNWVNGVAPGTVKGCGCTLNWIYVRSLKDMADIERVFGSSAFAAADLEKARMAEEAIEINYYVPSRGLYSENASHDYFSEHAQVWALLAAGKDKVLPALLKGDLDKCGIYFSFYFMAVCKLYGKDEAFNRRLEKYLMLADNPALDTLPEEFDAWRSYCHAWSSHSLYFQYASKINILDPIV